jgi:glycosyltransferase involved in cell wall biosynthesis
MTQLISEWTKALEQDFVSAEGLRIALFSGNYNCTRDGANNALNKLVRHLLDRGAAVRVYSPTSRHPAFAAQGDLVSVPSIAIPGRSEFRVALGLPSAIEKDITRFRPNIFHLSAPDWLGTAAQRLGHKLGVPVIASMHTRFETYFEYYGLGFLRSWAWRRQERFYRACDCVLAPNNPCRAHLRSMGVEAERISIWGRGVDTEVFSPSRVDRRWRHSLGYGDTDPILLFLGRLVREKGIDCFAKVVQELRRRGHHVRPLVIGEGPAADQFKRALGDAVFTGHLENAELGRAVASADILLNPSTTEAFGNVNLEALAAGLAVVSADADSARTLIHDGVNGLLRPSTVNPLANAVEQLFQEPWTAMRLRRAAPHAAANRDWPTILNGVVDTYSQQFASKATESPMYASTQ